MGLGFIATLARAELSLDVVGGYYSPSFGNINDELAEFNGLYGTDFEFEAGTMYGLALGYDVNPHFWLRLEYNSFESKTSDDSWAYYDSLAEYWDEEFKLTVTPVILSGIYQFSPFYVGAGIGSFATKFKYTYTVEEYQDEILVDSSSGSYSESDSPIGVLVLGGLEYSSQGFFGELEARYLVAKAELERRDAKVDWGGFQVCVRAWFKFK